MPLGPIAEIKVYFRGPSPQWVIELRYVNGRRYQIELTESQMHDFLEWIRDMAEEKRAKIIPGMYGYTITWEENESE